MVEGSQMLFQALLIVMGVLVSVLAWIGSRVHTKLDYLTDKIEEKFDQIHSTLRGIESDLREDLIEHDKRITTLEIVHKLIPEKRNSNSEAKRW